MIEASGKPQRTIQAYFKCLAAIQAGEESAVDDIMQLWTPDGHCELLGPKAPGAEFRGQAAVAALYRNLAETVGRRLRGDREARLARRHPGIQLEPGRTRAVGDTLVVQWNAEVASDAGRGYSLSGSNAFGFRGDKIKNLRIVNAPMAGNPGLLHLDELTINDLGRLARVAGAAV